jgi:hypothetical protein
MTLRPLPVLLAACILVYLGCLFRLHAFAYFLLDDLNNLAIAMRETTGSLIVQILNPLTPSFRPVVILVYHTLWRCFDLDPLPYHAFAWLVHTGNVGLLYLILARVLGNRYAAACGALLFAFEASYAAVLWEFGAIFELCCGLFFLLGLYAHLRFGRSVKGMLGCSAIFYLAMQSKEMAVTLPQVWLLSEWLLGGPGYRGLRDLARRYALPVAIQLLFVALRLASMGQSSVGDPYYMAVSPRVWATQMAWYLSGLVWAMPAAEDPAAAPCLLLGAVALAVLWRWRSREGFFFLAFVVWTLMPVVFLVNHRTAFYWYIPFVGIAGLCALGIRRADVWLRGAAGPRVAMLLGAATFPALALVQYDVQGRSGAAERAWITELSAEYRAFLEGLRRLQPPAEEVLYFRSLPRLFEDNTLRSALQVAFRRPDVRAAIVARFPPDAAYRLGFEEGRLVRLQDTRAEAPVE